MLIERLKRGFCDQRTVHFDQAVLVQFTDEVCPPGVGAFISLYCNGCGVVALTHFWIKMKKALSLAQCLNRKPPVVVN